MNAPATTREVTPWAPSKRATQRVKQPLPAPEGCPHCGAAVEIVNNAEIYGGQPFGQWPWAYLCRGCRAYVGMHPFTSIPLGTLANEATRRARKAAKMPFETWRQTRAVPRSEAYRTLADRLHIPVEECHFAWFDVKTCERAKHIAIELLRTTAQAANAPP